MTCGKPISVLRAQLVAYLLLVDLLHVLEVVLLLQLAHQHRLLVRIRRVLLLCVRTELRERLRVQRVLLRFQHSTTSHLCICLSSPSKSPKNLSQTLVGWVNTKIPTQVRKVTYYITCLPTAISYLRAKNGWTHTQTQLRSQYVF